MAPNLRSRLIAPSGHIDTESSSYLADVPGLFRRLLLFDTYILQSVRLKEIPPLVRTVGSDKAVTLLNSGALQLDVDCIAVAQIGQMQDGPRYSRGKPALPLGSFAFSILRGANYNEYLVRCIADIRRELNGWISHQALSKIEAATLNAILENPPDRGLLAAEAHVFDLRANAPVFKKALTQDLQRAHGLNVSESAISLRIIPLDDTDFKVESNLQLFGLADHEQHKCLERSLLAVGGAKLRVEDMRLRNALSGVIDDELPVLGALFDFVQEQFLSAANEKTFSRVTQIRKVPQFGDVPLDNSFDMDQFLAIRASRECAEFRNWLSTISDASDDEIANQVNTVRSKLGAYIQSNTGKGFRFAISSIAGFIPVAGMIAGPILSAIDCFIIDRIFSVSGPSLFLSRTYPTLFRRADQ